MKIFGTDTMKIKIVRNNTRKQDIICQSLGDSGVDYLYELEFNKRDWSNNDDIEVLVDNMDMEIGSDITIVLEH